jgi:hypothetical protein
MKTILFIFVVIFGTVSLTQVANAQPYGTGFYDANVGYGGQTQLTLATSGNVAIAITPTTAGVLGTSSGTVTVTSSDVVGYNLYIQSQTSTNMANGASNLPASTNVSAAALAVDTWGYNTTGTTNFIGSTLTNTLIHTATGPFISGDITTVTYGVKIDEAKAAGRYTANIIYTAVPQTN